jgi:hypothetical protein
MMECCNVSNVYARILRLLVSDVQNTGFSGGSIETMQWQGEWPGRAGVRRAGFLIDRALSQRECVLFVGTQFSNLYTSMYSPAGAALRRPPTPLTRTGRLDSNKSGWAST